VIPIMRLANRAMDGSAPPAETIVRTARGTSHQWGQGDIQAHTMTGVSVDAGCWLLVGLIHADPLNTSAFSIELAGTGLLTLESRLTAGSDAHLTIWGKYFASAVGSSDLIVTFDSEMGSPSAVAMLATQVSGLTVAGTLDVTAKAAGTSGTPSSGTTALPALAHEFVWGLIGTVGAPSDTPGAWTNGLSNGQRVGETGRLVPLTINEGFRVATAQAAQTASKTGEVSHRWGAICATFKAA